jgi:transposase
MKTPPESTNPHAKRYPESFKREALTLLESGRSLTQVSQELGVTTWSLRQWQKRATAECASSGANPLQTDPTTVALLAEINALRKQLARSELREDILKKALTILGQDPTDVSK